MYTIILLKTVRMVSYGEFLAKSVYLIAQTVGLLVLGHKWASSKCALIDYFELK